MLGRLGALFAVAACVTAAPASAGTVTVGSGSSAPVLRYVTYTAASDEQNSVVFALSAATRVLTVTDSSADLTVSDPSGVCHAAGPHSATCDFNDGSYLSGIRALLGDGNDDFRAHMEGGSSAWASGASVVYAVGGPGDDVLRGNDAGPAIDSLHGEAGKDTIAGGPGPGYLGGGPGADDIVGGAGYDTLDDIPRRPTADYELYLPVYLDTPLPIGLTITLDDQPGDGFPFENDNVHSDVEAVYGTEYNDVLIGSDGFNRLYGYGGNDRIDGRGGPDRILGGRGNDKLSGGDGDDSIYSLDTFTDTVSCGPGTDDLNGDAKDGSPSDCERVISNPYLPGP